MAIKETKKVTITCDNEDCDTKMSFSGSAAQSKIVDLADGFGWDVSDGSHICLYCVGD